MEIKVTLNGVERAVTKSELFDLATRGVIGPDTVISVNGQLVAAGKVGGIIFGSGSDGDSELQDTSPSKPSSFTSENIKQKLSEIKKTFREKVEVAKPIIIEKAKVLRERIDDTNPIIMEKAKVVLNNTKKQPLIIGIIVFFILLFMLLFLVFVRWVLFPKSEPPGFITAIYEFLAMVIIIPLTLLFYGGIIYFLTKLLKKFKDYIKRIKAENEQKKKEYKDALSALLVNPSNIALRNKVRNLGEWLVKRMLYTREALSNDLMACLAGRGGNGENTSVAEEIKKLSALCASGVLTQEEFEHGKSMFLGNPPDKAQKTLEAIDSLYRLMKHGALSEGEYNMKKWDLLSGKLIK